MQFEIIPVAEASVTTLMKSIDRVVLNPIIFFLFALALVYFLYGLTQYLLSPDNEEVRKTSKSHMIWGVLGLFIMVAVFGIMNLILATVGETTIKINNNGDYTVGSTDVKGAGASPDNQSSLSGKDFSTATTDPFKVGTTNTDPTKASTNPTTANTDPTKASTDPTKASTNPTKANANPMTPVSQSTKASSLIGSVISDALNYRVVSSGSSPSLSEARSIAINNALIDIAKQKGITDISSISYKVIPPEKYFPLDPGTGKYDYFIAIESAK